MADKIKYGIYPNPKPDDDGNTTYQVRHIPEGKLIIDNCSAIDAN